MKLVPCATTINYTVGTPPSIVIAPVEGEVINEGKASPSHLWCQMPKTSHEVSLGKMCGTSVSTQGATSSGSAEFPIQSQLSDLQLGGDRN